MSTELVKTDIDVANLALDILGVENIMDIEASTGSATAKKVANICRRNVARVRRSLLAAYPWSIAFKRQTLSPESETPAFDYSYMFLKPTNCLRVWKINGYRVPHEGYSIEGNYILANVDSLDVKFTLDNTTYVKWPPVLIDAFGYHLALAIATGVGYKLKDIGPVKELADEKLGDAMSADMNTDEFETVRGDTQFELERNYGSYSQTAPWPTEWES